MPEGTIYPLLYVVDAATGKLTWAYAVPKPAATGTIQARRWNRLTCSMLQAHGFVLDEKNAAGTATLSEYDFFFHLPKDLSVIGSIEATPLR